MPVTENCHGDSINYRQRYRNLKRKFRYLIYENECFQDELKKAQRKLLKVNQDKSFLLDRLLQYERIEDSSSESDVTISSDSELDNFSLKKKKAPAPSTAAVSHNFSAQGVHPSISRQASTEAAPKRKKAASKPAKATAAASANKPPELEQPVVAVSRGDGHMTSEEIERHLESRQILLDLVPERAPPTVPTEMFSNDPSSMERYLMDDELNDGGADTSPSNIGDGFTEEDSLVIDLPDQDGCI